MLQKPVFAFSDEISCSLTEDLVCVYTAVACLTSVYYSNYQCIINDHQCSQADTFFVVIRTHSVVLQSEVPFFCTAHYRLQEGHASWLSSSM